MLKLNQQTTFYLGDYAGLYDILIEKDNFWRQLNETLDWSFVSAEVQRNYSSEMGRPADEVFS